MARKIMPKPTIKKVPRVSSSKQAELAKRKKPLRTESDYAQENKQRQAEWEPGFRKRIEWVIDQSGGPGKVQTAAHIKNQTLQKMRKGGQRYCLLASFVEATGVNPAWLLLGTFSEPRWRSSKGISTPIEDLPRSSVSEPNTEEPVTDLRAHGRRR
jgi:hypothetical protein